MAGRRDTVNRVSAAIDRVLKRSPLEHSVQP
jgi:hypothetical protein